MTRDDLRIIPLDGGELESRIDEVGRLRIAVFREYPYLYDGSPDYERNYLRSYARSPGARIFLALDGGKPVGATTCIPLAEAEAVFRRPFTDTGRPVESICYFGESVLLPEYRGRGIGSRFFDVREAYAKSLPGISQTAFCAVDRPADDPRRPPGYRSLEAFWQRRGYRRQPDLRCTLTWKETGGDGMATNTLTFWISIII